MRISKFHKIDPSDIDIYNPEKLDNSYSFNIKYMKQKLIVQTPKIIINSLPLMQNSSKYYKIVFNCGDISFNNNNRLFINFFLNIENQIKELLPDLIKKIPENISDYNFISAVSYGKNKNQAKLTLNIQNDNRAPILSIFDFENREQTFKFLKVNSQTINLIMFNNIWINNNKIGLNCILLQTKVYEPFIKVNKCLINEDEEIYITSQNNQNCIKLLNLKNSSPIKLDIKSKKSPKREIPLPPPPPPISNNLSYAQSKSINKKSDISPTTSISENNLSSFIPSEDQLKEQIKKLKKFKK